MSIQENSLWVEIDVYFFFLTSIAYHNSEHGIYLKDDFGIIVDWIVLPPILAPNDWKHDLIW